MDTPLTFRQERFVFEYLKDQNASAAAARVGYTAKNMAAQGNELMSNPAVRERARLEMQSLLSEIRCSALELMKRRMRAAFFDARKMLRGWEPIAPEKMGEETRRTVEVSTVLRKNGPEVRVKQPDRHRALRAPEKVHERLDQLNEKYYAQLERAGKVLSLVEIAPARYFEKISGFVRFGGRSGNRDNSICRKNYGFVRFDAAYERNAKRYALLRKLGLWCLLSQAAISHSKPANMLSNKTPFELF